ncbi:tRNA-splicing endonuclease subunit Sen34-like isoform X2 [Panonychus citri]|uniref:tRNA-splicing endonuclease subunit Sen34-like isoform X2 n=1 Tax=Panonychus citri TaxID=50023 RepID=UPI002308025A|nr:tRNA-splicing endonuclease subunit Sen34-like isoform X2 [Panonychus citri]
MISSVEDNERIKIYHHDNQFLIWKAKDALNIRQKYRIVGSLIGPYPNEPSQVNRNGLPLRLLEEETRLLIDLNVADLIKMEVQLTEEIVKEYNQHVEFTRSDYSKLATERRLKEIESHLSSGSSPKGQKRKRNIESKESDEGLLEKETIVVNQFDDKCPWPRKEEVINGNWLYPEKERDKLLYNIFKDLWKRGYYITSGFKYGCDYLAYEYDPLVFHSKYMVTCQSQLDHLEGLQFLILNRVSSQVNKKLLIAGLVNDDKNVTTGNQDSIDETNCKPIYLLIDWQGNQDSPSKRFHLRPDLPI